MHKDTGDALIYEEHRKSKIMTGNIFGIFQIFYFAKFCADILSMKQRKNDANRFVLDEYIDENGDIKYRLLKNKFNFTDRASLTFNNPTKVCQLVFIYTSQ